MKLKTLFTLNAVLFGLTTFNFLFLSPQMFRLYSPVVGYEPGPDVIWTGRILSAWFLIPALLSWLVRDLPHSPARRAIAVSIAAGNALNAVIHVLAIMNGAMNSLGWAVVALSGLFAVGFWVRRDGDPIG